MRRWSIPLLVLGFSLTVQAQVWYVNGAQSKPGNGKTWWSAMASLPRVLMKANAGDQVWVTQGVYRPDGDGRHRHFSVPAGVSLYGGFTGKEKQLADRPASGPETVLEGQYMVNGKPRSVYHVVIVDHDVLLDSLTIQHGNANGEIYDKMGGGILNLGHRDVKIHHCHLTNNHALAGGALYQYHTIDGEVSGNTFDHNHAVMGAAIVYRDDDHSTLTDNVFSNNQADTQGGAVVIDYGAAPTWQHNQFSQNKATQGVGGAVYVNDMFTPVGGTKPVFDGNVFSHNYARWGGGAGFVQNGAWARFKNNTFKDNYTPGKGGAVKVMGRSRIVWSGNHADHNRPESLYVDESSSVSRRIDTWPSLRVIPAEILNGAGGLPAVKPLPLAPGPIIGTKKPRQ